MKVRVRYFASLRDAAGIDGEEADASAGLRQLYAELAARHGFRLPAARLRVAINDDFVSWDVMPADGDEVVFIPPVSGG